MKLVPPKPPKPGVTVEVAGFPKVDPNTPPPKPVDGPVPKPPNAGAEVVVVPKPANPLAGAALVAACPNPLKAGGAALVAGAPNKLV